MSALVAESTFVSRPCLSCCRLHAVAFAVHAGPPTALPVGHRCTVGVLVWTHWCATESRMTLGQCANPCCVLFGVVTSCVPCARARTSRSCATENTYTPARLEVLFRLSVVTSLSHSYHFTIFSAGCGCSFQLVILLKISSKSFCLLSAVSQFVLFT